MYRCNLCYKEATVDHINPVKLNCDCVGTKVVTTLEGHAYGKSAFGETPELNNNLTDPSAMFLKQMMSMILGVEFFQEQKTEIYAKNVVIEDSSSKRRFSFTLTAKEL